MLVALIEGDEAQISKFKKFVESRNPECAEVSNMTFSEYPGYVMSVENYMDFSIVDQLDKGVRALLRMDQRLDKMLHKWDNHD